MVTRAGFLAHAAAVPLWRICQSDWAAALCRITMPGSNLPTRYTQNITRQYWVDPVAGSDATTEANARDNQGNPWQTLQKVITSRVIPASGDTAVNIVRSGVCQAAGAATLDTLGSGATTNQRLIWRGASSSARGRVRMASGTTGAQHDAIKLSVGFNILEHIEIDSDGLSGPGSGSSDGEGVWVNSSTNELADIYIHDFQLASNATAKVQGVFADVGSGLQVWGYEATRIGRNGGAIAGQEHGFYLNSVSNAFVINALVYDMNNGWPAQSYPSGAGNHDHVFTHCTFAFSGGTTASGGLYIYSRAINNLRLQNSIFFDGAAPKFAIASVDANTGSGRIIDHCIVKDVHGSGDFETEVDWTESNLLKNTDPLFTNGAGRDMTLTAGSPARGFSDNTYSPPTDIRGNPRSAYDAGALEFQNPSSFIHAPMQGGGF